MHDAFVQFASFAKKETVKKPEAYFMRIALNLAIDARRASLTRGEEVQIEDVVILDGSPSADDVVLSRERTRRLIEGLSRMPGKTRAIFLASKMDGMTQNEIAERFGMTRSGVEWHLAKAVMQITSWMEGW
ncbi:RNA polymerase sigma factor, sigma-70 family [Ostertagia ostertagi]